MTETIRATVESAFASDEIRLDGNRKVSGKERYTGDIYRPNMLHAAFVASPHAYARIKRIDVSAAKVYPGVRAVLTAEDIGHRRFGRVLYDWPVLAFDTVSYIGDRVVALAAETATAAREAAKLVVVEYEELEPMLTATAAIAATAPAIHPEWRTYRCREFAESGSRSTLTRIFTVKSPTPAELMLSKRWPRLTASSNTAFRLRANIAGTSNRTRRSFGLTTTIRFTCTAQTSPRTPSVSNFRLWQRSR